MTILPIQRLRMRRVPVSWQDSAWTVTILVHSGRGSYRRQPGLRVLGRNAWQTARGTTRGLHARSLPGQVNSGRPAAATLRGRVSSRRALRCDPATLSRLTAFAGLPLCRLQAPPVRIFRVFQHPEFAL